MEEDFSPDARGGQEGAGYSPLPASRGPTGGMELVGAEAMGSSLSICHDRLCGQGASWSQGVWEKCSPSPATALPLDPLPAPGALTASQRILLKFFWVRLI